jgi:hypothetical protein
MSFNYHVALTPTNPLYQSPRLSLDLNTAVRQRGGDRFFLVIGSWRSGRSTTLLHLEHELLKQGCCTCVLDFMACAGMTSRAEIACYIDTAVRRAVQHAPCGPGIMVDQAKPKQDIHAWYTDVHPYLDTWLAGIAGGDCLVLLIEGLEKLSRDVQQWFTDQLHMLACGHNLTQLEHVRVVLFCGIELYDLSEANDCNSDFAGVFRKLFLNDLTLTQTQQLLEVGLAGAVASGDIANTAPQSLANQVYNHVAGHPYLSQCMGAKILEFCQLQRRMRRHGPIDPNDRDMERIAEQVRVEESSHGAYLDKLAVNARVRGLVGVCRRLRGTSSYPARDRNFTQLQYLGIARRRENTWEPRNLLMDRWLQDWLTEPADPIVVPQIRALSGSQFEMTVNALVAAFDAAEFSHMLRSKMGVQLHVVVAREKAFHGQISELVEWAQRRGRITELLQSAIDANGNNPELNELLEAL